MNVLAPICTTGYGYVGLNLVRSLSQLGVHISLFPIGEIEAEPQYHPLLKELIENADSYRGQDSCLKIWHQFDLSHHVGSGFRMAFPIFELDKFTRRELTHLDNQDVLFVASNWAKNILDDNGINHTVVVPLGVDQEIFYPVNTKRPDGPTRFINVGKWEVRKGHRELCDIFNMAFSTKDNVELMMVSHNPCRTANPNYNEEWVRYYMSSPMGMAGKIKIVKSRLATQEQLVWLMRDADCGVFLSRAEGWNMPLLEMLAMDKTVIATNNTAQTEYLTEDNAFLVETPYMELAYDGEWFHNQGYWHKLDKNAVDQAIHHMVTVHKDSLFYSDGQVSKSVSHLTWEAAAKKII